MGLSIRDSRSGQAVVEYVLLLVVTLMVVFGLAYQFNDAFKQWGTNLFSNYLACLLETGELPGVGGLSSASSECAAQYQNFALANGQPRPGFNGANSGGSSGGETSDSSNPAESQQDNAKENSSNEAGVSAARSRTARPSSSSSDRGRNSRANLNFDEDDNSSQKAKYTGSTEDSVSGALGRGGGPQRRIKRRSDDGLDGIYLPVDARTPEQIERAPIKMSEEGSGQKNPNRIKIKNRKVASTVVEEDKPMSFGDYFRYILIACIILALVIVVGIQFLSVDTSE